MNLQDEWTNLEDRIWRRPEHVWHGHLLRAIQLMLCTVRELAGGELRLRAMSLVYTTLLSLVPLLALAFSILKGLGVHNRIEPMLAALLEPLGPSAESLTATLIGFVDNVKIGVLGSIGIAVLFYTVLTMIQKVEESFNFIWKIPRQRPLGQRITEYLVVLLLGPLAISLILGITASMSSNGFIGVLLENEIVGASAVWLGHFLPYFMTVAIFTFLFMFIPNTQVQFWPACLGGLISGLLWQSGAWMFANFVAGSGNYNAMYSSFAIVILLLIWIYLAWLILLIGCQISFFMQHPEYLTRERRTRPPSGALRDRMALTIMFLVQQRFIRGQNGLNAAELARASQAPPDLVNPLINELLETDFLVEAADGSLLPKRDPSHLSVLDFLNSLGESERSFGRLDDFGAAVEDLSTRLASARSEALGDLRFGELLKQPR